MAVGNKERLITWLKEQDDAQLFEIKKYKEQRNKDQNRKYWKLLGQLSLKLRIGLEELHFHMLKSYSQRYEIIVPAETKIRGIDYCEAKSTINKNGQDFTVYHVYTPSHELNTEEFSLLLQGLCDECKEQGIETYSPDEIRNINNTY